MAKRRDWIFRGLLTCCALVFSASLIFFTQFLLQSSKAWGVRQIGGIPYVSELQDWDIIVPGLASLVLAFLLYVSARQRAVRNNQLRPSAGCPSCQVGKLVRVSRHPRDRILGFSFIPMGRFVCPNCSWEGRRIILKSPYSRTPAPPPMPTKLLEPEAASEAGITIQPGVVGAESKRGKAIRSPNTETEREEKPATPPTTEGPDPLDPLHTVAGYQLTDKWSNHVITVHSRDPGKYREPGEVVGTLHVQLWKIPGEEDSLQAWLDHNTTTVTIYKRRSEADRAQK